VLDLINRIKNEIGMTLLIVEHRIEWVAEHADRVIVMSDGMIVAEGSPREVFGNRDLVMRIGIRPPQVSEIFYYVNEKAPQKVREIPIALSNGFKVLQSLVCSVEAAAQEEVGSVKSFGEAVIEARDVWFRYSRSQPWVLQGVSIDVRRGEVLAIIGHSGAGKTTLVKHFNGLLKPIRGCVKVAGHDTRKASTSFLSRIVGLVFQNPEAQFFTSTIWEEMSISLRRIGLRREEIEERVKWALKVVDLEKPLNMSPHLLSFGEKHRLAIATILALKPAVIVLDEPFSGLDYKRSLQILTSLRKYVDEGGSVVLVAHDLQLISEVADRVAVLESGRIVRVGVAEEVLSDIDWLIEHCFTPLQSAIIAKKFGLPRVIKTRDVANAISKCIK
jgi:energy-coupling factor transport system ATP-binding protein